MTKNNNILDELFRSKLNDFEQAPPSYVWLKIQEKQKAGKRRAFMHTVRVAGIAAAVLLAFLLGWQLQEQRNTQEKPVLAEQEPSGSPLPGENVVPPKDISGDKALAKESERPFYRVKNTVVSEESDPRRQVRQVAKAPDEPESLPLLPMAKVKIQTPELLTELKDRSVNKQDEYSELTEKDLLVIELNKQIHQRNPAREEHQSWSVGALVTPAYAVNESSYDEVYASNMSRSGDKQDLSVGAGISVAYQTGRRWSIQSGIHYSRLDQSSGTHGNNQSMSVSEQLGYTYFNNKVRMQPSGNLLMNASAGVIEIEQLPASIRVSNSLDLAEGSSELLLTSDDFEQRFEYIEIPLLVRYQVIDKAWNMHLLGGMSTNVLVDNDVYLENGNGSSHIGKTKDMNTFNYAASFGFGMGYHLTDKIQLHLEPRLKYYLQSLSNNPDVNFKPYTIGIYTGVSYRF